ncbi:hypothetical protein ACVWWK_003082 [Bradyrhizobium sp. LB9.1b]
MLQVAALRLIGRWLTSRGEVDGVEYPKVGLQDM